MARYPVTREQLGSDAFYRDLYEAMYRDELKTLKRRRTILLWTCLNLAAFGMAALLAYLLT